MKTIEAPYGEYQKAGDTKIIKYPLQTPSSSTKDPFRQNTLTRPSNVLGSNNPPMLPVGVDIVDYQMALKSSVFIGQGAVAIHAGEWSAHSRLCVLVGTCYQVNRVANTEPYAYTKLREQYFVQGFSRDDSLRTQLQLNLWFVCAKKALGREPTLEFQRVGAPKIQGSTPLPEPAPPMPTNTLHQNKVLRWPFFQR